jgi:hypothetical protein
MLCEMPQALDVPWSPIVSAARLKGVLEPGARVTLITTAYYSGGWVTNPEFNYTTIPILRSNTLW